ncbi:unnamed protein product, partial [Coccothraustes coccothraustes]
GVSRARTGGVAGPLEEAQPRHRLGLPALPGACSLPRERAWSRTGRSRSGLGRRCRDGPEVRQWSAGKAHGAGEEAGAQ